MEGCNQRCDINQFDDDKRAFEISFNETSGINVIAKVDPNFYFYIEKNL